ncbi:hypothetical protein EVAR_27347_1 [Eumeta japonica]|uniref:PiggyBac transposable element-derived protein domain-containing protein n=1 Tax=Eumeta variegata TaxID=151549 RepID=A0A4C1UDS4_EUMVA|nr:hypothetical protein EVAR_27347_1 [Eumeta japonica]
MEPHYKSQTALTLTLTDGMITVLAALRETRSVRRKRWLRVVVTIAGLQSTRATIVVRATSYKIMNSREIAQIEAWLAEDDSENEVFGDQPSSNEEEDHLEQSDHQSESEQDGELPGETSADNSEPEEPPQRVRRTDFYAGVDGTMWSKTAPLNRGRTRSHNIVFVPPGPKGIARQKTAIPDCLSLFVDDNIIELLTKYTNIKIDYLKDKYSCQRDSNPTNHIEMRGYIGILHMAGVMKMSRLNTDQIFDHVKHTGTDAIYLTMLEQRFKFLTRALRFDNIEDRHDRAVIDKLAP